MTNGTTTLEFKHSVHNAVDASLDALTLAIAWLPDGSERRAELESVKNDLVAIRKRMSQVATVPLKH